MAHLKCVCFLRASEDSLEALTAELREPKYGEYYLCQSVAACTRAPSLADALYRLLQHPLQGGHRAAR